MTPEEFELHMATKVSWAEMHCTTIKMAIRYQFPEIQNLSVNMNEDGTVFIVFDETIYTQDQVQDFVDELKKTHTK
jgi:hypothetical protein